MGKAGVFLSRGVSRHPQPAVSDVPADERNRLIDLMVDLGSPNVDWGGYSQGWTLQRENRNQVRI
ncbi:MAG: hypothetical protein M3Q29_10740, partial [Chloroflexota bacterium]|nr:hypothetical protein [Chloroflexota bacterium]